MRADNYFILHIAPALHRFSINKKTLLAEAGLTKYERFDFNNLTNNRASYIPILKALIEFFPIVVLRDEHNLGNGFWVVGKEKIIKVFLELLFSTIKAIERNLTYILIKANRTQRKSELIHLILNLLTPLKYLYPIIPEETILRNLAKEYRRSIPALKNKKAFYAK